MEQGSPEQTSGHAAISTETVYHHAGKKAGGSLWMHRRSQEQRRKRYGRVKRRGITPERHLVDDRPAIVDERERIGDWEADAVIGKNHQQAIASIVERRTGLTLIRKVERKTAQAVSQARVELLKPYRRQVHTITSDNGGGLQGMKKSPND